MQLTADGAAADAKRQVPATMASRKASTLFQRLSADLASVCPAASNGANVRCPLCLGSFARKDLEAGSLTEEHIIPKELGGTEITLTCKTCNNTQGSTLESHLVRMLDGERALNAGDRPIRAALHVAGHSAAAEVIWDTNRPAHEIKIIGEASNPLEIAGIHDSLSKGVNELSLNLHFRYVPTYALMAVVRIAYLSLFDQYGYRFAYSDGPSTIREALRSLEFGNFPKLVGRTRNQQGRAPLPVMLTHAILFKSFLVHFVVIQINTPIRTTFFVAMPTDDPRSPALFANIERMRELLNKCRITLRF